MRSHTYNLFLTVEALEDNVYVLKQEFEEGVRDCKFGLIKPSFYKSFYELVNSIEEVKQDLLEKLSIKTNDHKVIFQLFEKVCVLESDLYSLYCVSPRLMPSDNVCTECCIGKPNKIYYMQDDGRIRSQHTNSRSSQILHKCSLCDSLSDSTSEYIDEVIYVGNYPSSETCSASDYESDLQVYDRDYYVQSKPTCKQHACKNDRKSKTKYQCRKKSQSPCPYTGTPKKEKSTQCDVCVQKKSIRKSKKVITERKIPPSAKKGVCPKKKLQKKVVLVREDPSSKTSVPKRECDSTICTRRSKSSDRKMSRLYIRKSKTSVPKRECNSTICTRGSKSSGRKMSRVYVRKSKTSVPKRECNSTICTRGSRSSGRKMSRVYIRKSKTRSINRKQKRKSSKSTPKKVKTKRSTVSVSRMLKLKPKKYKYSKKKSSQKFDVRRSNSNSIKVYANTRTPERNSHIYYVSRGNENPKDIFETKIKPPKTNNYNRARMTKLDTSSEELIGNESNNNRQDNLYLKVINAENKSRKLKNMKNNNYHRKDNRLNYNTKIENKTLNGQYRKERKQNNVQYKGYMRDSEKRASSSNSNMSDISNIPLSQREHIVQYNNIPNSLEGEFYNNNKERPTDFNKSTNKYLINNNTGSNNDMCVLPKSGRSPNQKDEVKRSQYVVNRYTDKNTNPMQSHTNKLNITQNKILSVNHKPQSVDTKPKAQALKSQTNGLQNTVYISLNSNKNKNGNNIFKQNENSNNQPLSLSIELKDNTQALKVNNHREGNTKWNQDDHKLTKSGQNYIISKEDVLLDSITLSSTSLNKNNMSNDVKKKLDNDTIAPVSNNNVANKQNNESLVYSLKFSKEKCRKADVSPMRSSLSLSDISTSKCKPIRFIEELHLSEHKLNGKEIHKTVHKCINHLEENEKNRMSSGCQKGENISKKSQKNINMRNYNTFRDSKNIHHTKSVRTMSECSGSLDWKTIAQKMKQSK